VTISASPATAATFCNASVGAGGDWPSFGHDASNTRRQPQETGINLTAARHLVKQWVFSPTDGGSSPLNSTATEAGGCVFVGSGAGWVYALDVTTGAVQWKTPLPTLGTANAGGYIVGAVTVSGGRAYVLVNNTATGVGDGPTAVALDEHTGAVLWQSVPLETHPGSYTNASPQVAGGLVIAGWSPAESDSTGTGGVVLLNATTGALVRRIYTIPLSRQAQGFAGGGIWTNPAVDSNLFAYAGTGNPYSKTQEDVNTNAIIKIDVNPMRATFGQIVGTYKGNVDQYLQQLQKLADSPICAQTASLFDTTFIDDPVCGQLDLDFGASPNLFTSNGIPVVGDLQKAGVYHTVRTATMTKKWTAVVGTPCALCNAAATAVTPGSFFGPGKIVGEGTLGGFAFKLDQNTGVRGAFSPIADAIHYQSFSYANGVTYTIDSLGFLDAFNTANGAVIARHPLVADSGQVVVSLAASGVSIARNHLFASVGSLSLGSSTPLPQGGYLVAYTK
jgi:outer membrane protein assembly factor BamB